MTLILMKMMSGMEPFDDDGEDGDNGKGRACAILLLFIALFIMVKWGMYNMLLACADQS